MAEKTVSNGIHTYHCICTTLTLASHYNLTRLPTRAETSDGAWILPLDSQSDNEPTSTTVLHNLRTEQRPTVIRREDGFEKRTLVKCARCDLVVGYKLDRAHFVELEAQSDKLLYIMPGSLVTTEDMKNGRLPKLPAWAETA